MERVNEASARAAHNMMTNSEKVTLLENFFVVSRPDDISFGEWLDTLENMEVGYKKKTGKDIFYMDEVERAISYIKSCRSAGIDVTEEFCEWTEYDYKTIRSPHNRNWSIPSMKDFKICPYCGKKIKVIRE